VFFFLFWNLFVNRFFFFFLVGLFVSCLFVSFLCLSGSSWLFVSSFLFWRWSSDSRPLLEFRSSCPRSPRTEMLKRIVRQFCFLLVYEIVQQIDTRDWRRHKGVRVFPISQTSTSRQLLLLFSFLDPAQFTQHIQASSCSLGVYACSISIAAVIINVFSSSTKLFLHVWNGFVCFWGGSDVTTLMQLIQLQLNDV